MTISDSSRRGVSTLPPPRTRCGIKTSQCPLNESRTTNKQARRPSVRSTTVVWVIRSIQWATVNHLAAVRHPLSSPPGQGGLPWRASRESWLVVLCGCCKWSSRCRPMAFGGSPNSYANVKAADLRALFVLQGVPTFLSLTYYANFRKTLTGRHSCNWYSQSPPPIFFRLSHWWQSQKKRKKKRGEKKRKVARIERAACTTFVTSPQLFIALLHRLMTFQPLFEQVSSKSAGHKPVEVVSRLDARGRSINVQIDVAPLNFLLKFSVIFSLILRTLIFNREFLYARGRSTHLLLHIYMYM